VKETVGLLSRFRRAPQSLEALEKLRDDLLDDTAWSVTMQWFDEDENNPQHFYQTTNCFITGCIACIDYTENGHN